jgi:hypothetical protein
MNVSLPVYRVGHSTRNALLTVKSDVTRATCDQQTTELLAVQEISAAFDTVDCDVLLRRFDCDFGISASALNWISSSIPIVRSMLQWTVLVINLLLVGLKCHREASSDLCFFALYTIKSPISNIVGAHGLRHRQCADDTLVPLALRPTIGSTFDALSVYVDDVHRWFQINRMLLNPGKTVAILLGTRAQMEKGDITSGISLSGSVIPFGETGKVFGVTLDSTMTLDRYVTQMVCSYNYTPHPSISDVSDHLLSLDAARMIIQGIVATQLNYCNGLFHGTSKYNFYWL